MKKLILSSSLVLFFSLYVLMSSPDASSVDVTPSPAVTAVTLEHTTAPSIAIVPPPKASTKSVTVTPNPTPTPKPAPAPAPVPVQTPPPAPAPVATGKYRNGTYTGSVADAFYGNVQVQVTVQGGKIANVSFLDYPKDRSTSVRINSQAMPLLISEAIQAQSANVNVVSGATDTSGAFQQSLADALTQATA